MEALGADLNVCPLRELVSFMLPACSSMPSEGSETEREREIERDLGVRG